MFDCTFAYFRGVEDPWNAIAAGGATGGLLAARAGPRAIARNAVIGSVLLALIEGVGILINKTVMNMQTAQMEKMSGGKVQKDTLEPPVPPQAGSGYYDDVIRRWQHEQAQRRNSGGMAFQMK